MLKKHGFSGLFFYLETFFCLEVSFSNSRTFEGGCNISILYPNNSWHWWIGWRRSIRMTSTISSWILLDNDVKRQLWLKSVFIILFCCRITTKSCTIRSATTDEVDHVTYTLDASLVNVVFVPKKLGVKNYAGIATNNLTDQQILLLWKFQSKPRLKYLVWWAGQLQLVLNFVMSLMLPEITSQLS